MRKSGYIGIARIIRDRLRPSMKDKVVIFTDASNYGNTDSVRFILSGLVKEISVADIGTKPESALLKEMESANSVVFMTKTDISAMLDKAKKRQLRTVTLQEIESSISG